MEVGDQVCACGWLVGRLLAFGIAAWLVDWAGDDVFGGLAA